MTPERFVERGLLVLMALALPLAAVLYGHLPPSIDQWQLDYTGWMVTRGHAPYLDIRDGNWPLSHWLHAGSVALWGTDLFGWRRTDTLILIMGVAAGTPLVARLGGRVAVRWWWFLHPLLYVTSGAWFAGQRDIVAAHFGLLALALSWRFLELGGRGRAALAGAGLTAAVLIKPTFALFAGVVPLLAVALARRGDLSVSEAIRGVAVVALFSVGALGLAALVLIAQGSTPAAFWEQAIVSIVLRVPQDSAPVAESLSSLLRQCLVAYHWLLGCALIVTAVVVHSGDRDARIAAGLAWSIAAIGAISYVAQGHNLRYYAGPVLVALSLLAAGALGWASRALSGPPILRAAGAVLIALALTGTASKVRGSYGELFPVLFGDAEPRVWEARFFAGDDLSLADAREIAAELAPHLPVDRPLLVWGRANALNLLTERVQPTGFYHPPHFLREFLPAPLLSSWEDEFIADLRRDPPAAAWIRNVMDFGESPASRFLAETLERDYRPGRALGVGRIYVRDVGGNGG